VRVRCARRHSRSVAPNQRQSCTESAARQLTRLAATGAVQPDLSDALLAAEPRAIAHLDASVRRRVLHQPVVRVKLWTPSGRIVYSDERALIGQRYRHDHGA
jgi:two-component system NarL family sensor kinase